MEVVPVAEEGTPPEPQAAGGTAGGAREEGTMPEPQVPEPQAAATEMTTAYDAVMHEVRPRLWLGSVEAAALHLQRFRSAVCSEKHAALRDFDRESDAGAFSFYWPLTSSLMKVHSFWSVEVMRCTCSVRAVRGTSVLPLWGRASSV